MSHLHLSIRHGQTQFRPGETLAGSANWNLLGAPQAIEVRLLWLTRGKGTSDANIVETTAIAAPAAMGDAPFRFLLPTAPHSFSGQLIALVWAIEIIAVDGKRRMSERREFVLTPFEAPLALPKIEKPLSPFESKAKGRVEKIFGRGDGSSLR